MKGTKYYDLPDGRGILDGFSKLIVFEKGCPKKIDPSAVDDESIDTRYGSFFLCHAETFTTKKNREAIKISAGESHVYCIASGSGDKWWRNWDERVPSNAFFADAVATTNGGGCWEEVIIMPVGVKVITFPQQSLMDEI